MYDSYCGRRKSKWRECILDDSSAVENFENPNLIKTWAGSDPGQGIGKIGGREGVYVRVLHEMRGVKGHNDKVFNHLAYLLVAHPSYDLDALQQIAFKYGSYVAKGGSPECLKGLYTHKTYHQLQVLDLLNSSLDYRLCDEESYRSYIIRQVLAMGGDSAGITHFFERERTRLGEIRIQDETMRYLG